MMYLYDNETAKRMHDERVRRSLSRKPAGYGPIDSYFRADKGRDADIVEVEFGTWCESQPLGA